MSDLNVEFTFKILLLGDGGVGKTSLVNRFIQDKFTREYIHTIGMQPSSKYLMVKNTNVCLSIFDIAGDESFKRLRELFYKGSKGALITFDLTQRSSFENVKSWYKEAKNKSKNQMFILIGNKSDLSDRVISGEEAKELAKKLKCADYIETSALTGDYVDDAFHLLGETVLNNVLA